MKKIHGTHSIQPNSITDAVISPDAQIDESKVDLAHTTSDLKSEIEGVASELTDHKDTSVNPHGNRLTQSTVRTQNIESSPSPTDSIINVSNPGGGDVVVDVAGETRSTRLHAGDANIEDALIVGGDTLIKGDLLIEGRYTVAHVTESEYKVMRVHPHASTAMDALSIVPVIHETDSEIDNLNQPMGVLIDQNGNLLVSDSGNHAIKKFTPTGNLIATYHSSGNSIPTSMAIYNNILVVVDIANKTVARCSAVDGSLISYLNDSVDFVSPYAVTVDKYGNIYVTESEGEGKGVYKFASEGAFEGKLTYDFTSPKGLAIKDDSIYVLDGNDIIVLDLNGAYQDTFGADFGDASLLNPSAIVAKDDKVYVADTGHSRVQVFDVNVNNLLLAPSLSIGSEGDGESNLNTPTDLTLDEENNIYVADTGNNAVKVFDKHGQPVTKFSEDEETYYGNLLNLIKRIEGQLSPALTLNYKGEMSLPSGVVYIGETLLTDIGHEAYVSKPLATSKITTTADGFRYVASDTYSGGHSVLNLKDADGSDIINVDYAGRASIKNSLSINGSNPITFDGATDTLKLSENTQIAGDLSVLSGKINLVEDESIKSVIESRSGDIGIGFHDHNNFEHRTIISSNEVEIRQATTKVNDLDVKGNVYIAPGNTIDGVDIGTHDHSGAAGRGVQLPITSVVGLAGFISSIDDTVRTNVTSVLGSNTLAVNKIKFTYDDGTGKVMATLANFSITIAGDAEGIATVNELSNTTLTVSVKNSAKLAGMLPSTTVNTEANRIVKTDASGNVEFKKVTVQPATSSSEISCLLASDVDITETSHEVKKFPITDIAETVLTHGTSKNAHTHDKINNMYVLRGSSTTQSNVGQVIYIDIREDTDYSVSITPNAAGAGEIWVVKALDSFIVYNDGDANITFDWLLVG